MQNVKPFEAQCGRLERRCQFRCRPHQLTEVQNYEARDPHVAFEGDAGWADRRISRHVGRSDAAIRNCRQEWVSDGGFQRHDSSGRLRLQQIERTD
ncbi:hypothetical protein TNCV_2979681 [Trichonephila clavipes]|nr:hypothetical protein TNCV_2979681 [Trichonephila clavipes]